jgi:KDO2-lipid IV(A) lauroyltransferase
MSVWGYSFRPGPFRRIRAFRLGPSGLEGLGASPFRVDYADVRRIDLWRYRPGGALLAAVNRLWRCRIATRSGRKFAISPAHYAGRGVVVDQSPAFQPFLEELLRRVRAANPQVEVKRSFQWRIRASRAAEEWLTPLGLSLARRLGCSDHTLDLAALGAQWIGPLTNAGRLAYQNLRRAYPEKSEKDIRAILRGMWDHVGRFLVEYANLDTAWSGMSAREPSPRLDIDAATAARLRLWRESPQAALVFAAHIGNVEMLSAAGPALGVDFAVLHCQEPVQRRASRWNSGAEARAIDTTSRAALAMLDSLRSGRPVAMAVDEHFPAGAPVRFFGRPCLANPTIARMARLTNCPIYGARLVRLPGNRFRLEVTEPIALARDAEGGVAIVDTMQRITDRVEAWVRETPEQWHWWHRRWRN